MSDQQHSISIAALWDQTFSHPPTPPPTADDTPTTATTTIDTSLTSLHLRAFALSLARNSQLLTSTNTLLNEIKTLVTGLAATTPTATSKNKDLTNIDRKLSALTSALKTQEGSMSMIKELVVKQQETASVLEKLAEEQGRQGRALKRLFGRGAISEETRRVPTLESQHSHSNRVDDDKKFTPNHPEIQRTPGAVVVVANTAPTSSDDVILIDSESGNLRIVGAQTNIDRVVPKPLPKKKRTLRDIQSEDEEALQYESMVPRHRASRWAGVERTLFDSYSEKSSTGESARNEDVGVGGPIRLSKEESDASPRMVNRTIEKRRRLLESDDEEELWAGME